MRYRGADSELEKLAKEVSQHAYHLVEQQYRVANDRKTFYTVRELSKNLQELTSTVDPSCVYHLDTKIYRCTCTFMRTELLPCRHAIYWRLISDKSPIPLKHIHPRWSLTCPLNIPIEDDQSSGDFIHSSFRVTDSSLPGSRHKVLNGTNKFRTAHDVCCRVADIMSRNGTPVYLKMLDALKSFEDVVKGGEAPVITRSSAVRTRVSAVDPLSKLSSQCLDIGSVRSDSDGDCPPTDVAAKDGNASHSVKVTLNSLEVAKDTSPRVEVTEDQSHSDKVTGDESDSGEVTEDIHYSGQVPSEKRCIREAVPSPPKPKLPTKRPNMDFNIDEILQSSSSDDSSFFLSKSAKSKGRPAVRKGQKRELKKQRMTASRTEAKQLVQGTLLPSTTLSNVVRVLKSSYSFESAHSFLSSFAVKSVGPRKQAIAKLFSPHECSTDVKFVLPEKFVRKCLRTVEDYHNSLPNPTTENVGIRVPKIGTFTKHQLQIMVKYYEVMNQLSQVTDTIEWMRSTPLSRLVLPQGLDEYAELDKDSATKAIQRLVLPMYRSSPFGTITNTSLLLFRQDLWINDDSIMHAMTTMQEELGPRIGIISPTFMGTNSAESRQAIIQKTQPFHERSHFVLLPLHIQGNHWCGAVLDLKASPGTITLFDPQQKKKQVETCEALVKELFPDIAEKMEVKHENE